MSNTMSREEAVRESILTVSTFVVALATAIAVEAWVSAGFDWMTSDEGKYSRMGVLLTSALTTMYLTRKKKVKP